MTKKIKMLVLEDGDDRAADVIRAFLENQKTDPEPYAVETPEAPPHEDVEGVACPECHYVPVYDYDEDGIKYINHDSSHLSICKHYKGVR